MSKAMRLDLTKAQLFIDDTLIDRHARVQRKVHQARKHAEPVLVPEHEWEGACPVLYGTVLWHEGRFRMWYRSFKEYKPPVNICYAESDDGVRWTKPELGLIDFDGSKANNICLQPAPDCGLDDIAVIDDAEDDEWPLKAIYWESESKDTRGMRAARSKDGLQWDVLPGYVLPAWGDRFNAMAYRHNGKFVLYGRQPGDSQKFGQDRTVSRTESDDLIHWSDPVLVNVPDLWDTPQMRIYSQSVFEYESMLLGFLERMQMSPDLLDPELIHSHDGIKWERQLDRPAFIERGPLGGWDGNWVSLPTGPPILHGKRLYFHYSGRSGCHATAYPLVGAFGLATLRRDGFVSIGSNWSGGWLQTKPIVWRGGDLLVNADTRFDDRGHPGYCHGEVTVEIRDEAEEVIEGYALDNCTPMKQNTEQSGKDCCLPIRWRDDRSLGALDGRTIRIRFHLREAQLYAFKAGE